MNLKINTKTSDFMQSRLRGVYVIADSATLGDALLPKVSQAVQSGAKLVQYRDKINSVQQRATTASKLKALCNQYQVPLIINDDIELAAQMSAGLHIGKNDVSLAEAKKQLPTDAIIGVSCYNELQLAHDAITRGASYVAFGSVFPSTTKPDAVCAPLSLLSQAHAELSCPICAIGGITVSNAQQLIDAGVDMLAIINGIFANDKIEENTKAINAMFIDH